VITARERKKKNNNTGRREIPAAGDEGAVSNIREGVQENSINCCLRSVTGGEGGGGQWRGGAVLDDGVHPYVPKISRLPFLPEGY